MSQRCLQDTIVTKLLLHYQVIEAVRLSIMTSAGNPTPCTRGDPWFQDGNIVLMPESGSKSESQVAFKVHRGVLSRHSEVFQTMFEVPQPGQYAVDLAVRFRSLKRYVAS